MTKEKKIDKETILTGALIEIKEIAEEVLKKMAILEVEKPKETEAVLTAQKELDRAETKLRNARIDAESEPTEEVPEITSEEEIHLSRPIVNKVSFGDPEENVELPEELKKQIEAVKEKTRKDEPITVSLEGKPSERDYIQLEDLQEKMKLQMQKEEEIATVKKGIAQGKSMEDAVKSVAKVPEQKQGLSEIQMKPVYAETSNKCPKCNSKLKHVSKVEKIGDEVFAINTATCTNKGKKSWRGKVIKEPCDYVSQSVIRID
jgi:hypothetical protein